MKTIIIDENYEGLYKQDWYFKIDIDINFPNCHIDIKIPLVSSKSIFGESLKVGEWLSSYGVKSLMSINISCFEYFCQIWGGYIKLGCRLHTKEEWSNFTDIEIEKMEGQKALNFWNRYKDFILSCPNEKYIEKD